MSKETKKVNVKLNFSFGKHKEGQIVPIEVNAKTGIPTERFWRRRFEDAKTDNCIEVVKASKPAPKEKTPEAK